MTPRKRSTRRLTRSSTKRRADGPRRLAPVVLACCCACATPPESPALAEGRYITILDATDQAEAARVCAGTLPRHERFVDKLFAFLGEAPPEGFAVTVYLVTPGEKDARCGATPSACYDAERDAIYVDAEHFDALPHELVHAAQQHLGLQSSAMLNEGLATYLGSAPIPPPELEQDPCDMFGRSRDELDYGSAAYFTGFLFAEFGVERVRALLTAIDGDAAAPARAAFLEQLGESAESLCARYEPGAYACVEPLFYCDDAEATPLPDDGLTVTRALSCEDADVSGLAQAVQWTRAVTLNAGAHEFSGERTTRLLACGQCPDRPPVQLEIAADSEPTLELPAGVYAWIWTAALETPQDPTTASIQRADPAP